METFALLRSMRVTGCTTSTVQEALILPAVRVTVAVPRPAVTTEPSCPTVTTEASLVDHAMLSVQLEGSTVPVSFAVCTPLSRSSELLLSVTLVAWKRFCTKVKPCLLA